MRVLIINSVCGRQSTGRIISDIQKLLVKNGHKCVVAYGEKNSLHTDGNYYIGSEADRYIHAACSRLWDSQGLLSSNNTHKLINYIRKYNPDVINLHNIHGYYLNYQILFEFLKEYKKPVVWTLHDCWAFTGHAAYCEAVNCNRWKTGCGKCPQKDAYPKSYTDYSKRNWNMKKQAFTGLSNMRIVTPSHWLADLVNESFLKEYPVRVLHNGVDLNVFKYTASNIREKYSLNGKKIILGVAAVWEKRKGLDDFIELSKMLSSKEVLVLIGIDEKQKEMLPKSVIAINKTDSTKQLAEWYSCADVFVNPTYEDNYPTVNIEALACRTKVITYNTGGSPECIDNTTGFIVDKNDINGVYNAIKSIKIGSKLFGYDVSQFGSEIALMKYKELFEEICGDA